MGPTARTLRISQSTCSAADSSEQDFLHALITDRIKNGSTMLYNGQCCSDPVQLRNREEIAQNASMWIILFP